MLRHFARAQDNIFEKSKFEDFITLNLRPAIPDDTQLSRPRNFTFEVPYIFSK